MASLAENLKPPFYVAVLSGKTETNSAEQFTPVDEMVSIAPSQPGFLGLETSLNKYGDPLTLAYWADMKSEKQWENRGDNEIRKLFNGKALAESCAIRVSKIEHKIGADKSLKAGMRAVPESTIAASISALVLGALPSVAAMFSKT